MSTSTERMLEVLGRGIVRSFKIRGNNEEKGSFPYIPPRSMTEEEKQYYSKHKHLNGMYGKE